MSTKYTLDPEPLSPADRRCVLHLHLPAERLTLASLEFGPSRCSLVKIETDGTSPLDDVLQQSGFKLSATESRTFHHEFVVRKGKLTLTFINDSAEDAMTPEVSAVALYD